MLAQLEETLNVALVWLVPRVRFIGENINSDHLTYHLEDPRVSYGPPWAHYLGGYQDRLLSGPLGLLGLCHTTPDDVRRKDYGGEVLG
jgi:hypothetical protein